MIRSAYLHNVLSGQNLKDTVTKLVSLLNAKKLEFDSFAVSGASGLLIAGPMAMAMSKEIIIVRKPGESGHSQMVIEGGFKDPFDTGARYVFLDDMRDTGSTQRRVEVAILERGAPYEIPPVCVAAMFYNSGIICVYHPVVEEPLCLLGFQERQDIQQGASIELKVNF